MKEERRLFVTSPEVWFDKKAPIITAPLNDKPPSASTELAKPVGGETVEDFLKTVLDLAFYAGVVPYHIKYGKTLRDFVIHRNKVQMVCCACIQMVTLLCQINNISILEFDRLSHDPTIYFHVFRRVSTFMTFIAWFSSTWSKSPELRTFSASSYKVMPRNYGKIAKTLATVFCLVYLLVGLFGAIFILGKTYWDPALLIKAFFNRTKTTFRIVYNGRIRGNGMATNPITREDIVLIIMQIFISLCYDMSTWFLYMFMISMVIVTWLHAKSFQDDVISHTVEMCPSAIYRKYIILKTIFKNFNSVFGLTLLVWIGYIVPFTSLKMSEVTSDPDWFLVVFHILYFSHSFIFFVLAADACAKVGCMNEWLLRDDVMKHFDGKKHNALLFEVANDPVAIQSYNGVFTVTYGFIGNIFTLMTSFFIIITQFKMAGSVAVARA